MKNKLDVQSKNLSKLNKGCTPCFDQTKIIADKIYCRELSKIKKNEITSIFSSMFSKNKKI